MNEIVFNKNYSEELVINKKSNKVRAFIIDKNKNITLTKCGDIFILPGGKIEVGESEIDALKRELGEELGCVIVGYPEIFLKTKHYLKNYPELYSNKFSNKLTETTYYYITEDSLMKTKDLSLDDNEIRGNFSTFKISIDDVLNILNNSDNPREKYFNIELSTAINNYKKTIV